MNERWWRGRIDKLLNGCRGRSGGELGFSLLELLVAMGISGILVATAIPQYRKYKERAYDYRAESDVRNVAIAEEAYYLDHERYISCENQTCTQLPAIRALSDGVTLTVTLENEGENYLVRGSHPKGSKVYEWDGELSQIRSVE